MTTVASYSLTSSAWTQIDLGGRSTVLLQGGPTTTAQPALVFVGQSAPSTLSDDAFFLSPGTYLELIDLDAGDVVYARAQRNNATVVAAPGLTTDAGESAVSRSVQGNYETVAASQTAQVLGTTGAAGDYISHILVVPATTSPGSIALLDNATSITVFTGGTDSVSNLVPFAIPLNMASVSGAWKVTTGTNVSCIAVGAFT